MRHALSLSLFTVGLTGCLDHKLPEEGEGAPKIYIALQSDFAQFESWEAVSLDDGEHLGQIASRTVYLNQAPPADATQFAVGTILIKTVEEGPKADWVVHAMVKRGSGFNPTSAIGWEFFEMRLSDGGVPVIAWRGEDPPDGHGYGVPGSIEVTEIDCTSCHVAAENDSVLTPAFRLGGRP